MEDTKLVCITEGTFVAWGFQGDFQEKSTYSTATIDDNGIGIFMAMASMPGYYNCLITLDSILVKYFTGIFDSTFTTG